MFLKSDSKLISLEETYGVDRIFSTVYIESRSTEKQSIRFRTEGIAEAFVLDFQNYLNAKTAAEKSDTSELIAKYGERLNKDLEAGLNLEEFLNSHSFLEQRVNFHGLNHGIDIRSVEKKVVDYLEVRMGYFLDPDKSIGGINWHYQTINELAGAMDIDNLLLQHVIDYMQSENKVKFLSDSLYEKDGQLIWAHAIVLTENVKNYKAWVEKKKKKLRLGGCAQGCLIAIGIGFILFIIGLRNKYFWTHEKCRGP
ncbi:MAG: hypothetical protein OXN25_11570 [Candidatus Poribacteria bacterium]|nr:hypothetical protein [Candidatus Poribacteria bacterium]